jgi:hypothetical protein
MPQQPRTAPSEFHSLLPLLLQALRNGRLQHLQLAAPFVAEGPEALAGSLPPSLLSLKSNMHLPLSADAIQTHFPALLPLQSLDITYICRRGATEATIALALQMLCERLPALTHLTLRPELSSNEGIRAPHASASGASDPPPLPVPVLAALSNLQRLHISGSVMVAAGVAASLPLLPALTRLQLGEMLPPEQASVLASLSGLRCLHLPWHKRSNGDWTAATLAALRRMQGLTELVLERRPHVELMLRHGNLLEELPFTLLLGELPVMLRRLVVADGAMLEEALRVCGGAVDEICAIHGGIAEDR